MADGSSGIASKTWKALKRTASGLGGSRRSQGNAETLDKPAIGAVTSGRLHAYDGVHAAENGSTCTEQSQAEVINSKQTTEAELDLRQKFLEEYDAAILALMNRTCGTEASCLEDIPVQEIAPWNRVPGFLGHLSKSQEQALQQLKSLFPESKRWHTDHDLLRFLRAREFDLKKTQEMYAKYIAVNLGPFETELIGLFPEREPALTARLQKLVDWFLHTIAFSSDRDGRPVVYFRPADIVKQSMMKHVPIADRLAFQSAANEAVSVLVKLASKRAGFHIENVTQVLDLQGMSAMQMVGHMRSPDAQQEWQHNMDFVPELLYKVYVINAPSGMSLVWKVASYFLPAQTKHKINVLGSGYSAELQQVIGSENMPTCYGGSIPFEWPQHRPIKELKY